MSRSSQFSGEFKMSSIWQVVLTTPLTWGLAFFYLVIISYAVLVRSVLSNSLQIPWTIAHQAPLSMGVLQAGYWSGLPCPPLGDLPNPGIEPKSPALQADSLPSEPARKPKNTGVGSLFLLQGIFLTQELNQDLLHCRRILYRLSSPGRIVSYLAVKKRWNFFLSLQCP